MKTFFYMMVMTALLALSGCYSSISITEHNVKTSVDFSQLKTWQWDHAIMGEQYTTADRFDLYESTLKSEVGKRLEEKNYRQIADGQSDFRVDYRAIITEEAVEMDRDSSTQNNQQTVNDYGPTWTFGGSDGPTFKGFKEAQGQVQYYEQCILHLGAFDKDGNIIWHLSASIVVNPKSSTQDKENMIRKTAQQLMTHFPTR